MDIAALDRRLGALWQRHGRRYAVTPGSDDTTIGYEERRPGEGYDWHGLKRGAASSVVVQYTVAGQGAFTGSDGRLLRLAPGMLFVAVIPTDHRYFLPPGSPSWRFVWSHIHDTAAIARLTRNVAEGRPVYEVEPDHPCIAALLRLWTAIRRDEVADDLALEQLLSDLVLGHARLVRDRRSDPDERQRLTAALRAQVLADPAAALRTADMAAAAGLARSAWAHHFARVVGLPPARFITEVRLEEVRRLLLEDGRTLADIAARTGFADANHLCKVFRRHLMRSPGMWRAEMRGIRPGASR